EASAASLPPLLLRLLPGGANQFPGGTTPLWTSAFSRRTQILEQCGGARPSHGEEADVAGERVRLILNRLADLARNRSSAYDSAGQSEMGGERGCNRAGHFHCRAVWHRRVTPKSIEHPQWPWPRVQTNLAMKPSSETKSPARPSRIADPKGAMPG